METGWPSMAASASMPPTPQPTTPMPLTIVVWESVPTQVSGYACSTSSPVVELVETRVNTVRARCSMLTWCTMPVPGGTTLKSSNAPWPHRRNW